MEALGTGLADRCDRDKTPTATLIVGTMAVLGVIITWWQKNQADKRSEWWRRIVQVIGSHVALAAIGEEGSDGSAARG